MQFNAMQIGNKTEQNNMLLSQVKLMVNWIVILMSLWL